MAFRPRDPVRPRDLAGRMAGRKRPDDGFLRETFTLPREVARSKAATTPFNGGGKASTPASASGNGPEDSRLPAYDAD